MRAQRRPVADGGCAPRPLRPGRGRRPSAGSDPGETLNPAVVAAMAEVGHRLWGGTAEEADRRHGTVADVMVTMGCGDTCPVYPGQALRRLGACRPGGQALEEVRPIRDDIDARVRRSSPSSRRRDPPAPHGVIEPPFWWRIDDPINGLRDPADGPSTEHQEKALFRVASRPFAATTLATQATKQRCCRSSSCDASPCDLTPSNSEPVEGPFCRDVSRYRRGRRPASTASAVADTLRPCPARRQRTRRSRSASLGPEVRPGAGDRARTVLAVLRTVSAQPGATAGWVRPMRCVARPSWASGWPS